MIYLIDDKKIRQEKYSWSSKKISIYKEVLTAIYSKVEFDKFRTDILSPEGIILFHDSFVDSPTNQQEESIALTKNELIQLSEMKPVVFFSGAISSRNVRKTYASMPVSTLYANLEFFLNKYIKNGKDNSIDLRLLAFGPNYTFEEIATLKESIWRLLYDAPLRAEVNITTELNMLLEKLLTSIKKEDAINLFSDEPMSVEYFKYTISRLINISKYE